MKRFSLGFCVLLLFFVGVSSENSLRLYKRSPGLIFNTIKGLVVFPLELLREAVKSAYDLIIRRPIYFIVDLLDKTCREVNNQKVFRKPQRASKEQMSLTLYTKNNEDNIPLSYCQRLVRSSLFKNDRPLVVFVLGWLNKVQGNVPKEANDIIDAYTERDEENFVFFDFHDNLSNVYDFAAYDVSSTGKYLGQCLANVFVDSSKIHIIGVSLGSQIAAAAANEYKFITGSSIGRITALDPSQPCKRSLQLKYELNENSADFVLAIHSCKFLGTEERVGHADFFVNRFHKEMPGCDDFVCSHFRAMAYYAESVLFEDNFEGLKCESEVDFNRNICAGNEKVVMGYKTPAYTRGTFYLNVKSRSPYGNNVSFLPKTTTTTSTTDANTISSATPTTPAAKPTTTTSTSKTTPPTTANPTTANPTTTNPTTTSPTTANPTTTIASTTTETATDSPDSNTTPSPTTETTTLTPTDQ